MMIATMIIAAWVLTMILIISFFQVCNEKLDQLIDKEDEEDKDVQK